MLPLPSFDRVLFAARPRAAQFLRFRAAIRLESAPSDRRLRSGIDSRYLYRGPSLTNPS